MVYTRFLNGPLNHKGTLFWVAITGKRVNYSIFRVLGLTDFNSSPVEGFLWGFNKRATIRAFERFNSKDKRVTLRVFLKV